MREELLFLERLQAADALFAEGKEEEAEAAYRELVADMETANGPEHPRLIRLLEKLAGFMWYQVRNDEAREFASRAFRLKGLPSDESVH